MPATQQFGYGPNTVAPNLGEAAKLSAESQNAKTKAETAFTGLELVQAANTASSAVLDPYIKQKFLADQHVGKVDAYTFMSSVESMDSNSRVDAYRKKMQELGENPNKAYVAGFQARMDQGYLQALRDQQKDYEASVLNAAASEAQTIIATSEISPDVPNPKIENLIENLHQTTNVDRGMLRDSVYTGFQQEYMIRIKNAKSLDELNSTYKELQDYNSMYFSGSSFRGSKSKKTAAIVNQLDRLVTTAYKGKQKEFIDAAVDRIKLEEAKGYLAVPEEMYEVFTTAYGHKGQGHVLKSFSNYVEKFGEAQIKRDYDATKDPNRPLTTLEKENSLVTKEHKYNVQGWGLKSILSGDTVEFTNLVNSNGKYLNELKGTLLSGLFNENTPPEEQQALWGMLPMVLDDPDSHQALKTVLGKDYKRVMAATVGQKYLGLTVKQSVEAANKYTSDPEAYKINEEQKEYFDKLNKLGPLKSEYKYMVGVFIAAGVDEDQAIDLAYNTLKEGIHDEYGAKFVDNGGSFPTITNRKQSSVFNDHMEVMVDAYTEFNNGITPTFQVLNGGWVVAYNEMGIRLPGTFNINELAENAAIQVVMEEKPYTNKFQKEVSETYERTVGAIGKAAGAIGETLSQVKAPSFGTPWGLINQAATAGMGVAKNIYNWFNPPTQREKLKQMREDQPDSVNEKLNQDIVASSDGANYVSDNVLLNSTLDYFAEVEGTKQHTDVSGYETKAYGVQNSLGLKQGQNEPDKDFAKRVLNKHLQKLNQYPAFVGAPPGIKGMLLSQSWNAGLSPNTKKMLAEGDMEGLMKNRLKFIYSADSKTGDKRAYIGLANRAAKDYNIAAKDLDMPTIIKTLANKTTGTITYVLENGEEITIPANKLVAKNLEYEIER